MKYDKSISGQMTVPGLLLIFLGLMVLSSLMPTIADTATTLNTTLYLDGYVEEGVLIKLVPLFIIVVFLSAIALYGSPRV